MEELLDQYGVDLAVWAHEHSYERLWPMFNYTVFNGSAEAPYVNPKLVFLVFFINVYVSLRFEFYFIHI